MSEFLRSITPTLAAVASVVGVLVALDQLTQRTRMRRIAEWSKELADGEKDTERQVALARLQTWATGQLVASVMVPGRFYLESVLWAAAIPVVVVRLPDSADAVAATLVACFVALSLTLRRGIRTHLERHRVASEFFNGEQVTLPAVDMLHQMEGGTRVEFVLGLILGAAVVAVSLGVRLVMHDTSSLAGPLLVVTGLGLAGIGVGGIRRLAPPFMRV